eukprot:TRINITY_DN28931_c0_g4_i1.p2 TRINITY_DN28931_c0_g4~~TRINITY_DN28931_c0_g4_i1.p2  ORF type:complete len:177 (-),score=16.28 TRINITY_DN28931_c0_g4_i1:311-841(-)
MLKKILEKLKALANASKQSINPEKFNDPVALVTSWSPAKSGGSNFRTHKLIRSKEHYDRLEFVPTLGSWLMGLVFLLTGLGIIIGFSITLFLSDKVEIPFFIPYILGGIFTALGIFIFRVFISKHTKDKDYQSSKNSSLTVRNEKWYLHFIGQKQCYAETDYDSKTSQQKNQSHEP